MRNICELDNISKSFREHVVLNNIGMSVHEGEMVAVMGKSGSGKTTLLNIIGLLEKPDSGAVKLFGSQAPRIGSVGSHKLLRTKISYLFQNYALIEEATINQNLEIPLIYAKKNRREKQQLKSAMLEKVGLKFSLSRKIYELSGGEQQRVAIARILLRPCELILADEPTGSLDEDNRNEIMGLIQELNNEGKTIIIVTHDAYIASKCNRIISLIDPKSTNK